MRRRYYWIMLVGIIQPLATLSRSDRLVSLAGILFVAFAVEVFAGRGPWRAASRYRDIARRSEHEGLKALTVGAALMGSAALINDEIVLALSMYVVVVGATTLHMWLTGVLPRASQRRSR